jgi:hypothetical protein
LNHEIAVNIEPRIGAAKPVHKPNTAAQFFQLQVPSIISLNEESSVVKSCGSMFLVTMFAKKQKGAKHTLRAF